MSLINPKHIPKNPSFIGRSEERSWLDQLDDSDRAKMIVIYGRRRVGKTELMEQYFADRNIIKFEGLENAAKTVYRSRSQRVFEPKSVNKTVI